MSDSLDEIRNKISLWHGIGAMVTQFSFGKRILRLRLIFELHSTSDYIFPLSKSIAFLKRWAKGRWPSNQVLWHLCIMKPVTQKQSLVVLLLKNAFFSSGQLPAVASRFTVSTKLSTSSFFFHCMLVKTRHYHLCFVDFVRIPAAVVHFGFEQCLLVSRDHFLQFRNI